MRHPEQDEASVAQTRVSTGPTEVGPVETLADVCARRAAVYEVLTYGFSEPSATFVAACASGEVVAHVRSAVGWLGAGAVVYEPALTTLAEAALSMTAVGVAAALGDLRAEHARLFTGPGRSAVRCYSSEYLDADERRPGRLNSAAAATAEAAYSAEGVSPAAAHRDLSDHTTTELEFLFHLCRREEVAWAAGESGEAGRLRQSFDVFLRGHAGLWLPGFAASVGSLAAQPVYVGMAELLSAHLVVELGGVGARAAAGPED